MNDLPVILNYLYRGARLPEDIEVVDDGSGPRISAWRLPVPQPTLAQLDAARPAALARQDLRATLTEYQGLLDERYRLFTRATANGNAAAQTEIQEEIQLILSALQEVRDALSAA